MYGPHPFWEQRGPGSLAVSTARRFESAGPGLCPGLSVWSPGRAGRTPRFCRTPVFTEPRGAVPSVPRQHPPGKVSRVACRPLGSTQLLRQVGWGRPKFIFFFTKEHQRKLWKGTATPKKSKQRGLFHKVYHHPLGPHASVFQKPVPSGGWGGSCQEQLCRGGQEDARPLLPLLAHLRGPSGGSAPWPAPAALKEAQVSLPIFSSDLCHIPPSLLAHGRLP
ncbi:hypothetical protein HJG60_008945 [Phyllostomus discolor]|uniref:Uncharacterized protein n=1 Tax=Phyllostomus discolor TaxID=89673 RepID=A0A833YUF5_9CHIR|nr:hypothetical protein HJG60_008945 [Phyllostomus discolor]